MKYLILIKATEYAEEMTGRKEKDFQYWCSKHDVYGETQDEVHDYPSCVSCEVDSTDDDITPFSQNKRDYIENKIDSLERLIEELEMEIGL